jgi:putative membrane protein
MLLDEQDRNRISQAIAAAESKSSGEIVCVVAHESDTYLYVSLAWAALLALIVPLPLILATSLPALIIYLIQLLGFAAAFMLLQWRPLRIALVPPAIKRARAHRRALEQFLVQNLYTTAGRTGVLIFVSVAERYAEVIADEGIYMRAPRDCWDGIVTGLTARIGRGEAVEGFIEAVEACGALLATHFPPGPRDRDELPNHLIVL